MDINKAFKNAKWFAVGMLVLVLIVFIFSTLGKEYTTFTLLINIGLISSLIGTIIGCNNYIILGPICGIIASTILIIFGGLIEKIFGILYLIDCIKLIKALK